MKNWGRVRPEGFFRRFLETQMEGLTGHIEKAGYPFDCVQWGEEDYLSDNGNEQWWVYEQTAYWLDGFIRCAILLEDQIAIARASKIILRVLRNPEEDGYLGPHFLKRTEGWNRWPHVVFFRSCMALYQYNEDERILDAIERHYLSSPCDYSGFRDVLNCEIMLWLYGIRHNEKLLKLAMDTYRAYNEKCDSDLCDRVALSKKKPYAHGVSYNEYSKLGAIFYLHTGDKTYLEPSVAAYKKIDRYFMLPGGCNCSDEFMISNNPMRSIETCDVTDYTWSLNYLLSATGNTSYADHIEKCIFNAGIGAVTEDFRALQYFSCANQIVLNENSNHNAFFRGSGWMQYAPNPGTECCPGNVNRFMPNYLLNAWRVEQHTVTCQLFADTSFCCFYNGNRIDIREKTNYPFEEQVVFSVKTEGVFIIRIRVPGWAKDVILKKDGKQQSPSWKKGKFLEVIVSGDCELQLSWESDIVEKKCGNGIYFEKGPLVYSLGMKGNREAVGPDPDFPAYRMSADKPWQYGYAGTPIYHSCDQAKEMDLDTPLPYLAVPGKKLANISLRTPKHIVRTTDLYKKVRIDMNGEFVFTPNVLGAKPVEDAPCEMLRLYPYAACKLRMTVLPKIKQ